MIFEQLSLIPVAVFFITSLLLVVYTDWKVNLTALFVQYLGVFWLTALVWPTGLAAVKLVAGWMAGAVLTASQVNLDEYRLATSYSLRIFRVLSAGVVWLVVFNVVPLTQDYLPVPPAILVGGILLIGMGLLQLGMTTRTFHVILGLLTVFSGFEMIYAAIEVSVLVAGLLAAVNLGLAAAGAYIMSKPEAGGLL